ncbi:MAG: CHAT domain-containing protein [Saprospiraceae bacterium]|nr:CHAT domain-containing protein [Saprospiraceae bacterium]
MKFNRIYVLVNLIPLVYHNICISQNQQHLGDSSNVLNIISDRFEYGNFCEVIDLSNKLLLGNLSSDQQIDLLFYKARALSNLEEIDSLGALIKQLEKYGKQFTKLDKANYQFILARQASLQNLPNAISKFDECARSFNAFENPYERRKVLLFQAIDHFQNNRSKEARNIIQEIFSNPSQPDVYFYQAMRLSAFMYFENSDFSKSRSEFETAIEWFRDQKLGEHPFYVLTLVEYASTLLSLNELEKGEELLLEAEPINKRCEVPTTTASILWAKAALQNKIGDFDAAIKYFAEATKIYKKLGKKEAVQTMFLTGQAHFENFEDSLALAFYNQALSYLEIFSFYQQEPIYLKILAGKAETLRYLNQIWDADSLYRYTIKSMEEYEMRDQSYSTVLNNYALFLEELEDYSQAVEIYHKAEMIDNLLIEGDHPDKTTTIYNIARCYSEFGQKDSAVNYYRKANDSQLTLLKNFYNSFDEETSLSYRWSPSGNFDVFFDYACSLKDSVLNNEIENLNLATKGLVLDYFSHHIATKDDSLSEQWRNKSEAINAFFLENQSSSTSKTYLDSLVAEKTRTERQLMREVDLREKDLAEPTVGNIVEQLNQGEIFIDFFNYHRVDDITDRDSIFYYGMIIDPNWSNPMLVYLGEEKEFEDLLFSSRHYTLAVDVNYELYRRIWLPLEKWIEGAHTIHLSPDGIFNNISFAGLATDEEGHTYLIDKYQLKIYATGRDFLNKKPEQQKISKPLLVGDPAFDYLESDDDSRSLYFSRLAHARDEIDHIQKQFEDFGVETTVLLDHDATEPLVRSYLSSEKPDLIHFATHGFFLERDTTAFENPDVGTNLSSLHNPMYRSGIVLTGANHHWHAPSNEDHLKDGILTAAEILLMDLSSVKLVVLSACETGRGKVTDGEGVFGLQRALKVAGAHRILLSLWKVPDQATAELMTHFFKFLLQNLNPDEALQQAQITVRKAHSNPYYWSGFLIL